MTTPVANQVYPLANGLTGTGPFITYFSTRNPTANDINFVPTQRWFNTATDSEWILVSFTITAGVKTANWAPIGSALTTETLTGNTGGPVPPTAGNINVIGAGTVLVSGNPATSTLTITVTTPNLTVTFVSTSPYVVATTDQWLAVNVSTIPITIELPNTAPTGYVYYVKDYQGNAAINNITVTTVGGGGIIDGSTNFIMNSNYQEASFLFDGTAWEVF
jgi:hypothetical protein